MKYHFLRQILIFVTCLFAVSCKTSDKDKLPEPCIKAGIATVSGRVTHYAVENGKSPVLTLAVPNPVTAEPGKCTTTLEQDGSFMFEIPVELNMFGNIGSDIFDGQVLFVDLVSGGKTELEIDFDPSGRLSASMRGNTVFTANDAVNFFSVFLKMLRHKSRDSLQAYPESPEEFVRNAMKGLKMKLDIAANDSLLSEKAKTLLSDEFSLIMLNGRLLDYPGMMRIDYMNLTPFEEHQNYTAPPEPGRSYYSFLKYFDLNNPLYLYNFEYPEVLQALLSNDTPGIPPIGDKPVDRWMEGVTSILADLVGFNKGLFYDLLAANSYALQFNGAAQPLSDRQKENITKYFTGKKKEFAKILLNRSKEIEKIAGITAHLKVNGTPAVSEKEMDSPENNHPEGLLVDSIVARYRGKAVVMDFWATWCAPCLNAMQTSRELKQEMLNKNVIFVYLANTSSPKRLWENKIQGIGGEHYYLNGKEWESISFSERYGFTGVPTYLIFDTNGILKHKFTAYPGNDVLQKMITDLLVN